MNTDEIKHIISTYFRGNNLLSQRLPQVYILYKSLKKIGEHPKIFMGYLVNHTLMLYYIHYWIELDGEIHDIIGESYNKIAHALSHTAELKQELPINILDTYINMDSIPIEKKRMESYQSCINGTFFEHMASISTPEICEKITTIYNTLIE